jgi:hypothetical protein
MLLPQDKATSPAPARARLAVFGDSHYACVRMAQGLGLVDLSEIEVEYWGHVGRRFNFLECRDGVILPKDDFTAQRFAKFNEKGRTCLPAADFDVVLFVGARIDVTDLMIALLSAARRGEFVSKGLARRMVRDRLNGLMAYRFAQDFAAHAEALIVLSPVSFPTAGVPNRPAALIDLLRDCTAEDRAKVWDMLAEAAAEDGLLLIPQPEETVVDGVFTATDYAVEGYLERVDYAHRNAAYGAAVMRRVLGLLKVGGV